jgi:hypothetical protein
VQSAQRLHLELQHLRWVLLSPPKLRPSAQQAPEAFHLEALQRVPAE